MSMQEVGAGLFLSLFVLSAGLFLGKAMLTPRPESDPAPQTIAVEEEISEPRDNSTIVIDVETLPASDQIQLGAFPMEAGVTCTACLRWESGATELSILCQGEDIDVMYPLINGQEISFIVPADGEYSFPICNTGPGAARELSGSVHFSRDRLV